MKHDQLYFVAVCQTEGVFPSQATACSTRHGSSLCSLRLQESQIRSARATARNRGASSRKRGAPSSLFAAFPRSPLTFAHPAWLLVVPPLSILEVLHRIVDTLKAYFNHVTERRLATDAVTVYLLLDEMIDNGFPLSTELNVLREMIQPPSLTSSIMNELTGKKRVKETLASGVLTNTIWRKADVRYTNNECFVDCLEQVDAIVTRQGMPVTTDIKGVIMCKCKLSGMPDLLLSFVNPRVIEDVYLHPCVRIARWNNERVFSFVPPDGEFKLAEYSVGQGNVPLPVEVRSSINYVPTGPGRVEILCSSKTAMGLPISDCRILVQFPKCVNSVSVTPSVGNVSFDSVTKLLAWDVRTLAPGARANLRGSVMLQSGEHIPDGAPSAQVKFRCAGMTASGLKVNRLDVFGEVRMPHRLRVYPPARPATPRCCGGTTPCVVRAPASSRSGFVCL